MTENRGLNVTEKDTKRTDSRYLKIAVGNMYGFVTHMWSPLRGTCPHECKYCYVVKMAERFGNRLSEPRLDERHFVDLGEGKTIFVCHMSDLFAEDIPSKWIEKVVNHCKKYPKNTYLFQSKNPERFRFYGLHEMENVILATTVECDMGTEYNTYVSSAPLPWLRLSYVRQNRIRGKWLITIEPVLKFSSEFWKSLVGTKADMIAIGADSKKCDLEEPTPDEVRNLIEQLRGTTKIFIKGNLKRLVPEYGEGWL